MNNRYSFYTLDVFTEQIFGGNPLAVFPEASGLDSEQMQAIAQELNLSETVFVFPPEQSDCDYQLRIFTPRAEIPFAGHPTVGTAYLLAHLGLITPPLNRVNLQEGVGKVPVTIHWENNHVTHTALSAAKLPEFSPIPNTLNSPELFSSLLNLQVKDLHPTLKPDLISCGLPFLYIPLQNLDALNRCTLNNTLWQELLINTDAAHIYPFTITKEFVIHSRMFAPALGIIEDPATGSAATSLAGYLHKYYASHYPHKQSPEIWQINQGIQMGRPSKLTLSIWAENSHIHHISVGGSSVLVSEGLMSIPAMVKGGEK